MGKENSKVFGVLQRVGRAFMLPIALLPIAGLLLGIGASFTNQATVSSLGLTSILGQGTVLNIILTIMSNSGNIIFANLPILFAMGVALGMAKKEQAVAALSGAVAYFVMHSTINALLTINNQLVQGALPMGSLGTTVGITSLQMGVFGGIIVGLGVAALHNKFYDIELPQVLGFFGGTRFVPIVSAVVYIGVGILMYFVWQPVQQGIMGLGSIVNKTGYIGTFIYGVIERALIPFGLHHVFYMPFWQTAVGGSMQIGGKLVEGAQNIFFAQLADPNTSKFSVDATKFMAGKFPFMMFGLPGAALAMYTCANTKKKKIAASLLISAAITAFLTGITEPIEFTFIFVAPLMYGIHCILAGLSFMLMHILNVGVGMTFSGGFIDFLLFGVFQGTAKSNWIWIPIVGVCYFVIYYFLFRFLILKFNYKTPGREEENEETKLYTKNDYLNSKENGKKNDKKENGDSQSALIIAGLGGYSNIEDIDCCATRLRVTVKDPSLTNEQTLKSSGASGVIKKGNGIQVVYGPKVNVIKTRIDKYIESSAFDLDKDKK